MHQCALCNPKYGSWIYNYLCKGTLKLGHIKQVVAKYSYNLYEMHCEEKVKLRSHNTSYCLIEVATKSRFDCRYTFYIPVL